MLVEDAVVTLQDLWPTVLEEVAWLGGTLDSAVQVFDPKFGEAAAEKVRRLSHSLR